MKKLRTAVIGVGSMGRHHARILSELDNSRLTALVDKDLTYAGEIGSRLNVPVFGDHSKIVDMIDAAVISAPTVYHYSIAKDLIKRGKHLIIEKPITVKSEEAGELIDLSKKNKTVLMCGHLERFNPAFLKLKKVVKDPFVIQTERISVHTNRNLDIGIVSDLMIHDLELVINLVDSSVKSICAYGVSVYSKHEDYASVGILFKNGCFANLVSSRISHERYRKMKVIQKNRTFELDFANQKLNELLIEKDMSAKINEIQTIKQEPLRLELDHFLKCIVDRKKPQVLPEDAKKAVELASLINKKMVLTKRSIKKS